VLSIERGDTLSYFFGNVFDTLMLIFSTFVLVTYLIVLF